MVVLVHHRVALALEEPAVVEAVGSQAPQDLLSAREMVFRRREITAPARQDSQKEQTFRDVDLEARAPSIQRNLAGAGNVHGHAGPGEKRPTGEIG